MEQTLNEWSRLVRAILDVWIGMVIIMIVVDCDGMFEHKIPKSGGRFLVTCQNCKDQLCHNDFESDKNQSPDYFVIATGQEEAFLYDSG